MTLPEYMYYANQQSVDLNINLTCYENPSSLLSIREMDEDEEEESEEVGEVEESRDEDFILASPQSEFSGIEFKPLPRSFARVILSSEMLLFVRLNNVPNSAFTRASAVVHDRSYIVLNRYSLSDQRFHTHATERDTPYVFIIVPKAMCHYSTHTNYWLIYPAFSSCVKLIRTRYFQRYNNYLVAQIE